MWPKGSPSAWAFRRMRPYPGVMKKSDFDKRVERLNAVDDVISKLDEAIKVEAFSVLRPFITGEPEIRLDVDESHEEEEESPGSSTGQAAKKMPLAAFLKERGIDKGNKEIATAILTWSEQHEGKSGLSAPEIDTLWTKLPVKHPGKQPCARPRESGEGRLDLVRGEIAIQDLCQHGLRREDAERARLEGEVGGPNRLGWATCPEPSTRRTGARSRAPRRGAVRYRTLRARRSRQPL